MDKRLKQFRLLQTAESEADKILSENLILEPPVPIVEIARNYGLLVREVDLGSFGANVAGFIDPMQKIIYVNIEDKPSRQAFTVAHEFAHWILHQQKLHSEPDKYAVLYRRPLGETNQDTVEKEANAMAARLLVPRIMLEKYKDRSNISTVAKIFGVSDELISYRLQNEFGHNK